MSTVLITGANRGIGLAMAREATVRGNQVIATARSPEHATDLHAISGVQVEQLDVADAESCRVLGASLKGRPIDILINNAGVFPKDDGGLMSFDCEAYGECLRVNGIGPLLVTRALIPNIVLGSRKLVVQISSQMGSIAGVTQGGNVGNFAYHSSKAALNMANALAANELRPQGIACVAIHPGWVQTDMGGSNAHLKPEESVQSILNTIQGFTLADSGRFMRFDGTPIDW